MLGTVLLSALPGPGRAQAVLSPATAVAILNSVVPGEDPELTALLRAHPAYAMFCRTWEDYIRLKPSLDLLLSQAAVSQDKPDEDVATFAEACRRRGMAPARVASDSTEQAVSAARQAIVRELNAVVGWNAKRIARFVYRNSVTAVCNVIAKGRTRPTDNAAVNAK